MLIERIQNISLFYTPCIHQTQGFILWQVGSPAAMGFARICCWHLVLRRPELLLIELTFHLPLGVGVPHIECTHLEVLGPHISLCYHFLWEHSSCTQSVWGHVRLQFHHRLITLRYLKIINLWFYLVCLCPEVREMLVHL